jgi:hypothetical protein
MRLEGSATAISWIPSEAVKGMMKLPFSVGAAHYDEAPPDRVASVEELEALRDADRFRFANRLEAWIEVEDGRIVDHGRISNGMIGSTTIKLGASVTLAAVSLPDIDHEPEVADDHVRFTLTAGGRTGAPAPRRVNHPPFVQFNAPLAWSTLQLTLHADGRQEHELVGASPFPRHWIYGSDGSLLAKSGMIDFKDWFRHAFGKNSPWGDEDSPALATAVETALERDLSHRIMKSGTKPRIKKVKEGKTFVEQGEEGDEMFLLLDGVLAVEVDGERVAELGPGSVGGERALLEGGRRTCTLRALTPAKVAIARSTEIDPDALEELRDGHRREDQRT